MLNRIRSRLALIPPVVSVLLGVGLLAGAAAGGVFAYRTYNYIQHDNEFCLSCHLMQDPYERFAQSAHRDLGCKACHQPTFVARSTMALTQILENPDSLETHAQVPNERCEDCHVRGNPEEWVRIAQSAGHRIHLESSDSVLQGLQCVQCHSTSLHEFAASDQTCGQAGCHEGTRVRLGRMGDLTIHCASCHEFNAPVANVDSASAALRPESSECLSCHAMRQRLVGFPDPANDPHGGSCGSCHNPHEQTTPAEAVANCTNSGCHESPEEITPFHRGIGDAALANCISCHVAHGFEASGATCANCHADVSRPGQTVPATRFAGMPAGARGFSHAPHATVECARCHTSRDTHGEVTLNAYAECQSCHHAQATAEPCTRCHVQATLPDASVQRTLALSTGATQPRRLPFDHGEHTAVACSQCHAETPARSAAAVDCASCHTEHHVVTNQCTSCHTTPRRSAHNLDSHLTCGGAGCHDPNPFPTIPSATRTFCLACHQDLADHRPGRPCGECHALPAGG